MTISRNLSALAQYIASGGILGQVAALPTQTGNSGKYLITDGTTASWGTVSITPTAISGQDNTATNFLSLPRGTTAQRPVSPINGYIRYNTDTSSIEAYGAAGWVTIINIGVTWTSFYDFRQSTSATTAYRYDAGNSGTPAQTASYNNSTLIRRTTTINTVTCAGIAQAYSAALNYARMNVTVNYPTCTIMQVVYKPNGGFDPGSSGGLLAMGLNFGNSSWNVQTDSYRDGASNDAWAFSVGGDYTSGTRYRGTAWPTAAGIYTLFTVYDGTSVYRYINTAAGDTINATPYITITPGTGAITNYGILDAMSYGAGYSDGATFWSCAAVWNKVLTTSQMNTLALNRIKLASDTSYFGTI